ncbi:MAG: TIGR03915 family putative DNA repair protein [Clostridia bacterium]|nr:TIGR03915 family putative DNA repair protein [Clostridia bacterium]
MHKRTDVIYVYDGSLDGLLTAVFESFERRELPNVIISENEFIPSLFSSYVVVTDHQKADRVRRGVRKTAGEQAWNLVRLGYLTCIEDRGALVNDFVHMAMRYGGGVTRMLADETVNRLSKAVRALTEESHKYKGFVRFSVSDNTLSAVIEPKNSVLPLLAPHFCDRYPNESFLIYDKTHRQALIWHDRQRLIVTLEDFEQPKAGDDERYFRALWKHFYDTVAIEARYNPRCRMNFMPKRYWSQLPEMDEENTPELVRETKRLDEHCSA